MYGRSNGTDTVMPGESTDHSSAAAFRTEAVAYTGLQRLATALLQTGAAATLLAIFAQLFFSEDPPDNPLRLMRAVAGFSLLPALGAACLRRFLAASVTIEGATLTVRQRQRRIEVPLESISEVEPWNLPLPGPGLCLRLRSGRRLAVGLE